MMCAAFVFAALPAAADAADTHNEWKTVRITMGLSTYEPGNDRAVIDTVRRADKDMYENKRARKAGKDNA